MRPDNHLLDFRTRNGAFVPLLLFGLAAATLIGGCPWIEKPGTEETPSGGRQETTAPGGGSAGGGAGTTGGGETPASGSTIPQPPALSTGVHAATLQADEAKRYRLPMSSGESAIVNATVPDEATDVDLLVYAPRGTAPLSSSRNDAGMPDYVEFTATESGDYALEVINKSASRQAGCTLNFQHIPSDSSVQDALNGIYTMVESGGQPMPPGSSASWVIANGRLVSLFGVISADLLGLTEDLRYWVDVAPGNATELHYMGADIVVEVQNSEIMPLGDRNYLLSVSKRTTGTEAGSTPVVIEDTTQMLLALTADGCALCGSDVIWALTINGVPLGDIGLDVGPRLEKCPSSEVCDTTPTFEPPAAPSSPQPSNGASDTLVDVDLNWADAARATSYDVYFGTANPPPLAGNTASSSWPLATLNHDTTYFWKVVAKNSAGSTPGPVWSFTTETLASPSGPVIAWGINFSGQCTVPTPNDEFVAVAAGAFHSLGLRHDGSIVAWGGDGQGQCVVPSPNSGFVAIAAGAEHSLGLKSDGSIVAWGSNYSWTEPGVYTGQSAVPTPNNSFVAIAAGPDHSLGLKADGSILAWGNNYFGQCSVPAPNSEFIAIAAGGGHSLGLKSDGSVRAWGSSSHGQTSPPIPNTDFVAIAAGEAHSLALKADGSVRAWGLDSLGQCTIPFPNSGFGAVAAGYNHSLGLKSDGSIVAWGMNDYGQCSVPTPNSGYMGIAGGYLHSLAVRRD